jgi:hypothetical protein
MKRRLSLITEIIAPYRIPVFNALAARDDLDLQGIFLLEADRSLRQWQVYKSEIRSPTRFSLPSGSDSASTTSSSIADSRTPLRNLVPTQSSAAATTTSPPGKPNGGQRSGGFRFSCGWKSTAANQRRRTHIVESMKRRFLAQCQAFVVPGKSSQAYLRQFGVPDASIFHQQAVVTKISWQADCRSFQRLMMPMRVWAAIREASSRMPSRMAKISMDHSLVCL